MPLVRWVPAMLLGTFFWGCIYGTVGMAVLQAWLRQPVVTAAAVVVVIALVLGLRAYWRHRDARRRLDPEVAAPLD